jgi:tetratricopeptide (TPR) repeat protein
LKKPEGGRGTRRLRPGDPDELVCRAAYRTVSRALSRFREAEQLLKRDYRRSLMANLGWTYHAAARPARRGPKPGRACDRILSASSRVASPCSASLGRHRDPSRPVDAESGEAHYQKASALAEELGMRPLTAHCHLGLAKLYRRTGKREQAQEHLTTATTMYREMDMRFWLEQAEAELRQFA